jgi:hypothetical protein
LGFPGRKKVVLRKINERLRTISNGIFPDVILFKNSVKISAQDLIIDNYYGNIELLKTIVERETVIGPGLSR